MGKQRPTAQEDLDFNYQDVAVMNGVGQVGADLGTIGLRQANMISFEACPLAWLPVERRKFTARPTLLWLSGVDTQLAAVGLQRVHGLPAHLLQA